MRVLSRLLLEVSKNEWLARRLPEYPFVRRSVRRFIPGETLEDALAAAEDLREAGLSAVFTRLGENVTTVRGGRDTADHYRDVLDRAGRSELDLEISVKLTQLGLDTDRGVAEECLTGLVRRAERTGSFVWVDMEESRYVDATLQIVRAARSVGPRVGVCLQAYLHRTPADLEKVLERETAVRLVKGAYREPPEIAVQDREQVNRAFVTLSRRLLASVQEDGLRHAFATHDGGLLERVLEEAGDRGVSRTEFEVQMLYGIRSGLQRELAAEGGRVRVLVSYGSEWFPWFVRRLAERPANLLLLLKNLV